MQKSKFKSLLHYHFIVFIFGFTAILGALISLDAIPLVWYRMVIGTLGLGIVLFILKQSFVVSRTIFFVAILSGIMISLHWITFFGAVKQSSVSLTLSVLSSGAFITSLLEPIFYKRKKKINKQKKTSNRKQLPQQGLGLPGRPKMRPGRLRMHRSWGPG